jgi:predicted amidophosphoribosyltransferase
MKKRKCLECKKMFDSTGSGNRFCEECQKKLSEVYKENRYTTRYAPKSAESIFYT